MIMDDNRIMEAAKLIANSSAALIQAIGMMSENIERANRGESLAYTEDQFMKLIQDNGITYNDVKVVDSNIETMVESKAKSFVNELRRRYDMAFAAFVVDNMRKQNMLKEDKIAELLKDNPNEKQGRCQRKTAICAHDTARTGEGQGIIPGMV